MKFRKKPVVIEAVQLTWSNWNDVCELALTSLRGDGLKGLSVAEVNTQYPEIETKEGSIYAEIPTLEGSHLAQENDWIIQGVNGEIYPCKPDIFEKTYEAVNQNDQ